jgi:hypothetical protein
MRDEATSCCCSSSAALASLALVSAVVTATPAAPSKVFNNPRLLLLTPVLLTVGFLSSGLETFAETLAMTGMESLIGDDDEREGNKRVLPVNSLPNDVGVKRAAIPVAVAMVYCTQSVFKQNFSSVENNNFF